MLCGNVSSIQVHLGSYLCHPHWLWNTMKYVQVVDIDKKIPTLWAVFISDTPTGNGFSSTFLWDSTILTVADWPTFSPSFISHVSRSSIHAAKTTPTASASDTINEKIDCKLYPVLVTQKYSNRELTPWFVPSLDWTNTRHTTFLFRQPGSINWIPNDWYFLWFPSVTPLWISWVNDDPRISCTVSFIMSYKRKRNIFYSASIYCHSL